MIGMVCEFIEFTMRLVLTTVIVVVASVVLGYIAYFLYALVDSLINGAI